MDSENLSEMVQKSSRNKKGNPIGGSREGKLASPFTSRKSDLARFKRFPLHVYKQPPSDTLEAGSKKQTSQLKKKFWIKGEEDGRKEKEGIEKNRPREYKRGLRKGWPQGKTQTTKTKGK